MAQLVGAIACSHGPLLSIEPALWDLRGGADRKSKSHWYKGTQHTYDDLMQKRHPGFVAENSMQERNKRFSACQQALDTLAARFDEMKADVAIIVGNDQLELFKDDLVPAMAIFTGERIENIAMNDDQRKRLPPGVAEAEEGHCPRSGAVYPGAPALALELVDALGKKGFDIATCARFSKEGDRQHGIPHAFGFIYRRIMRDSPPPTIPLFLNVAVGANAVRSERCIELGHALKDAITALPADLRVVLIASGGLSHFVVDEELDAHVLSALARAEEHAIAELPADWLNGNTAEIKSWLPVAVAANKTNLAMDVVDYVACYRTEAGTGSGMAFVSWK